MPDSSRHVLRGPRQFFWRAMAFWAPILIVVFALEIVLVRGRETVPVEDVLAAQKTSGGLFMRRFLDQELQRYKLVGLLEARADVLVLGSSKVMNLRSELLPSSLYNAGGVLQQASDLEFIANTLARSDYQPRAVLIGYDFWWFSPAYVPGARPAREAVEVDAARSWRAHWRAGRDLLLSVLRHPRDTVRDLSSTGDPKSFGFAGMQGSGFRVDGSVKRAHLGEPSVVFKDRERPPILTRIRDGLMQFRPPDALDADRISAFLNGVSMLRDQGVSVVVFSTPLCTEGAQALREHPAWGPFLRELRKRLRVDLGNLGVAVHELETPAGLGIDDRYYADCLHGMETMGAILMAHLASRRDAPDVLREAREHLRHLIARADSIWYLSAATED